LCQETVFFAIILENKRLPLNKNFLFTLFNFQQSVTQDSILIYHCYGNARTLHVEGRVLNEREFKETKRNDNILRNIWRHLGHLLNDERKNTAITLTVNKQSFHTTTDSEGYFLFNLKFIKDTLQQNHDIYLQLDKQKNISTHYKAFVPSQKPQIGIISDFDDTVIISDVTHKLKLLNQLLLKNYKQRKVVNEISNTYKSILNNTPDRALFFITGSPNQVHTLIENFLKYHHFPRHALITKKIHGLQSYSLLKQKYYKSEEIEELIKLYPNIQWVLFGDSGEHDKEIYLEIAKKHIGHIKEIYIRNVKNGKIENVFPHENSI